MITVDFLITSLIVVLIPGTGVVYTVSTADFQALPDGSAVSVGYGPSPQAATNYGNLNKGALSVVK